MTDASTFFRRYKPTRSVDLYIAVDANGGIAVSGQCLVTELYGEEGWAQWRDSVFMRDFEDWAISPPAPVAANEDHATRSTLSRALA
jgi:hypothetical protein